MKNLLRKASPKTTWSCGHKKKAIIMNSNLLSLSAYFTWKEQEGRKKCFGCWCDEEKGDR